MPCGAAGKEPVDGRLNDEFAGVAGIDASAVEYGNVVRSIAKDFFQAAFDDFVHFFCIVGAGGSAVYADGPYRFIGYPDVFGLADRNIVESDFQLSPEHFWADTEILLLCGLADTEKCGESVI